jgi:hypothetical protein
MGCWTRMCFRDELGEEEREREREREDDSLSNILTICIQAGDLRAVVICGGLLQGHHGFPGIQSGIGAG